MLHIKYQDHRSIGSRDLMKIFKDLTISGMCPGWLEHTRNEGG